MCAGPRIALVTGAARRVGGAIALSLAESGCDVALHCRSSRAEANELRERIEAGGRRCCVIEEDLADAEAPRRLTERTVEVLGDLHILINNASIFERMSLVDFETADWNRTLQINLTAIAALCHHARPHLERGEPGHIINLCDIAADRPWKGHLAYCVSKAGLVCLTKALARELAPGVLVNGISPGIAEFPPDYDQDLRNHLVSKVPLKRPGTPEDIARTARFLVTGGQYITGQIINVDGGRSIA